MENNWNRLLIAGPTWQNLQG